jgi:hypothetical protein
VGWAVWGRTYLNRFSSAASSVPGPLESVEARGGGRAGSQSLMTRSGVERVIEVRSWFGTHSEVVYHSEYPVRHGLQSLAEHSRRLMKKSRLSIGELFFSLVFPMFFMVTHDA